MGQFARDVDYLKVNKVIVHRYINSVTPIAHSIATRHASYRTIKTLYCWLHAEYGFSNPIQSMPAPILGKPIMPSLDENQVALLIESASSIRDKAIIALLVVSGIRLAMNRIADPVVDPDHVFPFVLLQFQVCSPLFVIILCMPGNSFEVS